MDRNEAVLRELNLYPQWKRRDATAPKVLSADVVVTSAAEEHAPIASAPVASVLIAADVSTASVFCGDDASGLGEADTRQMGVAEPVPGIAEEPSDVSTLDWAGLKARVKDCTACGLRAGCTQTVFGAGDEHADWLFVGEGPGAEEDALGEPFVGQSGKLLDNMLMAIHLKRGENVYIANVVKCLPPEDRTPHADEIAQCLPYLQRQIELIKPKLIVALGKTAATALLHMGKETTLGSLRGTLHDYNGIPLVVTYHPAYLLRSPMEKAKAWQDLCLAVNTMAE